MHDTALKSNNDSVIVGETAASTLESAADRIQRLLNTSLIVRCADCNTPAAVLVDSTLIIEHRHHGQRHRTYLNLRAIASAILYELPPAV